MKKLIILYGAMGAKTNGKVQRMIDGGCTCGYRSYAEKFGEIIYLTPQKVSKEWEKSIIEPSRIVSYLKSQKNAVVWSVKHDKNKDRHILKHIKGIHPIFYYSCNSQNILNGVADVSLVDTPERLKKVGKNGRLYVKGKNPEFWDRGVQTIYNADFDYVLCGRRGDKNEIYFMNKLTSEVEEKRKVLWIGGSKFSKKHKPTHHDFTFIDFSKPSTVRTWMGTGKVGILFTELKAEGFPQTFLEMTMVGIPVVYNVSAPRNPHYFHENNVRLTKKKNLIETAEFLLEDINEDPNIRDMCRQEAIDNYSLEKSYERMLSYVK